jgi:branched-chain amino acid transport system ATP-binding protein
MAEPLLKIRGLKAGYGDFQALFGLDVDVFEGEVLALIGANGAGKSTLIRTITGLTPTARDMITFKGEPIGGMRPDRIAARGIALVPEGRRLFRSLSVEENLVIGGERGKAGPWNLEAVYSLFPALKEKRRNAGTALSGGQQQMVAIGRALMANPELILFDEISLGLAPIVIKDIYAAFPTITGTGVSVLLVEQDVSRALSFASRFICMQKGKVSLTGEPTSFTRAQITAAYFGT